MSLDEGEVEWPSLLDDGRGIVVVGQGLNHHRRKGGGRGSSEKPGGGKNRRQKCKTENRTIKRLASAGALASSIRCGRGLVEMGIAVVDARARW